MLTDTNEIILHIADLIEKGSQGRMQITGQFFEPDKGYGENGVCAIGACLVAVGVTREEALATQIDVLKAANVFSWPKIPFPSDFSVPFAADDNNRAPLIDVIIWMNDRKGYSFERIVQYLRGLATIPPEAQEKPRKTKRVQS